MAAPLSDAAPGAGAAPESATGEALPTLRVVSVSLGSATRDHVAQATLLGRDFSIERRGTGGDLQEARRLLAELDGTVDAIGLGGIDLYVVAGGRRYVVKDAARLAAAAQTTPVVDGSGLKHTLERATVRHLQESGSVDFKGSRVLLVSAVDRFGMAEELVQVGAQCVFGDLLFVLGVPVKLRSLQAVSALGALILPVATRLPFKMLYPTGEKQEKIVSSSKHTAWFDEADVIAGDFLLIRRFLPARMEGKTVLTNTVTPGDLDLLRERGVRRVITTTPEFRGRSFGTNVMEGVFVALGARTPDEYLELLRRLDWQPRIVEF